MLFVDTGNQIKVKSQKAFTLAEILITLGIIGVVAAIIIPALNNQIQDMQFKTAYKKAYSDASNVWQKMAADYEVTPRTGIYDDDAATKNFTAFKSHFKTVKDCAFPGKWNSNKECWDFSGGTITFSDVVFIPQERSDTRASAFIDAEARQWIKNEAFATYGEIIIVDTNGFKKPNKFGKDRFPLFPSLTTCVNRDNYDILCNGAGTPEIIKPYFQDVPSGKICNVDNCYYNSWLYN